MDELIGKKAYKKRGFFSGIIGVIEKSDSGITPYKLVYSNGSGNGFNNLNDIILIEEDGDE